MGKSVQWLLGGLIAAAGVGLLVTLRKKGEPSVPSLTLTGKRMLLLGDSLGQGLAPTMRALAAETGVELQALVKQSTMTTSWTNSPELAASLANFKPDFVLVVLGTNDLAAGLTPEVHAQHVQALLAKLAPAQVIWVSPPKLKWADTFTPSVRDAVGPRFVFDSTKVPMEQFDGVHTNAQGYATWAAAIWAWLRQGAGMGGWTAPKSGPNGPQFLKPRPRAIKTPQRRPIRIRRIG